MTLLTPQKVKEELSRLQGWELERNGIAKTYRHRTFKAAMRFVNRVAEIAEEMNHHPEILIVWRTVTLTLITHDEGGLTQRDFRAARKIDES